MEEWFDAHEPLIGDWFEVDKVIYVWDGGQWVDNSIIYYIEDNEKQIQK